ncbi:MAG: hypothetical protein WBF24_10530 [Xanthobacteraceae bacterium]
MASCIGPACDLAGCGRYHPGHDVVCEFTGARGASTGLGWYITNSLNVIDMTGAVTALFVMAVVAMAMYYAVLLIERRLLAWRPQSSAR